MFVRGSERLAIRRPYATLRRVIAVSCMLAFLTVGFVHSIHHIDAGDPAATRQVDLGGSKSSPEPANKAHLIVEHCLGCTIIAVVPTNDCDLPMGCSATTGGRTTHAVRPHGVGIELPPPKSST